MPTDPLSRFTRVAVMVLTAAMRSGVALAGDLSMPKLRQELLQMQEADQLARAPKPYDWPTINTVDARHTARLKEIIAAYGWPSKSLVGKDGAMAAWLIAQHATKEPAFQMRVLDLMKPLGERDEVEMSQYAYLYDRLHRPQRYGTQGQCTPEGKFQPREIEDAEHVDERRAQAGVGPPKLADYVALVSPKCPQP